MNDLVMIMAFDPISLGLTLGAGVLGFIFNGFQSGKKKREAERRIAIERQRIEEAFTQRSSDYTRGADQQIGRYGAVASARGVTGASVQNSLANQEGLKQEGLRRIELAKDNAIEDANSRLSDFNAEIDSQLAKGAFRLGLTALGGAVEGAFYEKPKYKDTYALNFNITQRPNFDLNADLSLLLPDYSKMSNKDILKYGNTYFGN